MLELRRRYGRLFQHDIVRKLRLLFTGVRYIPYERGSQKPRAQTTHPVKMTKLRADRVVLGIFLFFVFHNRNVCRSVSLLLRIIV